jgi:hypothetical protein
VGPISHLAAPFSLGRVIRLASLESALIEAPVWQVASALIWDKLQNRDNCSTAASEDSLVLRSRGLQPAMDFYTVVGLLELEGD